MPGQEVAPGCVLGPPPEIHNAPLSATELAESQEGRQYGLYLEHLEEIIHFYKEINLYIQLDFMLGNIY